MPAAKKAVEPQPEEFVKPKGVHAKLAWIQTHIANVEKSGRNAHHNYNYMQEHGLIDLLRPYLRLLNCSVVVSPADKVVRDGNRVTLIGRLVFVDADEPPFWLGADGLPVPNATGSAIENPSHSITATFAGEGMDNQDKATNKAHTSFTKYALQKFFLVPTEHVDDSDSDDVKAAEAVAKKQGEPLDPAVLEEVLSTIRTAVEAGTLDRQKVKAKLATLHAKAPAELDAGKMDVFFTWVRGEIGEG